ncbi:hypothetical protein [Spiroplasma endosymbiont of Virgichneumon dumeticola]|uniref:hypothetical protein n=1 Tax=Spiroplasma endosymbiont of Virgichneumon dumeticola TaxID=3139323 RepID=UPI0035C93D83
MPWKPFSDLSEADKKAYAEHTRKTNETWGKLTNKREERKLLMHLVVQQLMTNNDQQQIEFHNLLLKKTKQTDGMT